MRLVENNTVPFDFQEWTVRIRRRFVLLVWDGHLARHNLIRSEYDVVVLHVVGVLASIGIMIDMHLETVWSEFGLDLFLPLT